MGKEIIDYLKYAHGRMQREETNEFIYRRWFGNNGFENFKADMDGKFKKGCILSKQNKDAPFSTCNFLWVKKPSPKPPVFKPRKQKTVMNCKTIKFTIDPAIDQKLGGIYKITFDNGKFYIGSSKNFTKRISCWCGCFNGISRLHNKLIIQCLADCNSCHFELIEYMNCSDIIAMKKAETICISSFIGNSLLLNRAHDASSNKGVRWTEEERAKTKNKLQEKYNAGLIKAPYYYKVRKKATEGELFKSKYFGDKE